MVCALVVRKLGRAVNRKKVLRVMRERRLIQRRRRLDRRRRPLGVNKGKRSIAIDLTYEEGRDVLHRLIADTEVLDPPTRCPRGIDLMTPAAVHHGQARALHA